ncbi:MAG: amphi-Trp domain-containing protein [Desulfobulbaceae bacterium]|nr:amphi-Trp domain-containing protein [Desulfobulbaceae bacterium]
MSAKNKVACKKKVETAELIYFLENILEGMKSRNVLVKCGKESVQMSVPNEVKFEIGAKQKKEKNKISIEISWELDAAKDDETLKIGSGESKENE